MKKFIKKMNKKGFTLVELIIVIVVIGILAGMATPKFIGVARDAKVAGLQNDIDTLRSVAAVLETKRGLDGSNIQTPYGAEDADADNTNGFTTLTANDLSEGLKEVLKDADSMGLAQLDEEVYKANLSGKLKSGNVGDFVIATQGDNAGEIYYNGDNEFVDANGVQHFGLGVTDAEVEETPEE